MNNAKAQLCVIKLCADLSLESPLPGQLQVIHAPMASDSRSAYDSMYSVIHHAVSPFLDAKNASTMDGSSAMTGDTEQRSGNNCRVSLVIQKLTQLQALQWLKSG